MLSLYVLALLAINPWHIMQSQWVLDCNFFPHVFVMSVYFMSVGIIDKKDTFLYVSMIFFAITLYTYGIALYLTPIFLLIIAIYLIIKKQITIKKLLLCACMFLVISLPIVLMTIINLFGLETIKLGNITIQNFKYVGRQKDMLIFSENKLQTLLLNIKSFITTILLQFDGLSWNAFPIFGTIYLISLPICLFGIIIMLIQNKEKNKNEIGRVIIFTWVFLGVICGILINDININRINIIWYALIICTGIGIYNIIETVKHKKTTTLLIMVLYLINFVGFIVYFDHGAKLIENSFTWSKGLVAAIEYVEETKQGKDITLSYNVCNTDKKDIFIRYATKNEKIISREKFIKYYYPKEKKDMDFSTNKSKYTVQELDYSKNLDKEIYVITNEEVKRINNIEDYEINTFNKYMVLIKK